MLSVWVRTVALLCCWVKTSIDPQQDYSEDAYVFLPAKSIVIFMIRPCFLVVDRNYPASISSRKLIIETAKLNVITAYSSLEALETLKAFPSVHGVVLDGLMKDMPCGDLISHIRETNIAVPIIVVGGSHCGDAVLHIDHYDPQSLLAALKKLEPEAIKAIEEHDAELVEQ